jgi:ABC-type transport system substrate-binding protein
MLLSSERGADSSPAAWDVHTVTFELRDDVYWHDGVRTTAHDLLETLAATLDRVPARPLWLAIQRRIAEQQPYTIQQYQENVNGVARCVENVDPDIRGVFSGMARWWIPPAQRAGPPHPERAGSGA